MANENFIVDPSSVSITAIKNDLQAHINAAPDAAKWKDFFASSTGTMLVELLAGFSALINYNIVVARREAYLPYAQNRSSAIGEAEALGYSVFRGRNAVLRLTILPSVTTLFTKYSPIGSIKDQQLIVLNDTPVTASVATTIDVVVGNLNIETITIPSASPNQFRFTAGPVSSDVRVKLNSVVVSTSEAILDMISEKFVIMSNVFDSVDINYLNLSSFTTKYVTGDQLEIEFVTLKDTSFVSTDLKFDYGTLVSYEILSAYQSPESVNSIKVNAPVFHETQFLIRGREDYLKIFKTLNADIVDTSYVDISAAVVDLCYVDKNSCLFTTAELAAFIAQLSSYRPMGVLPPTISHPHIDFLDLTINLALLTTGDVTTDVRNILSELERNLGIQVKFSDLEKSLEGLSYVKVARISFNPSTWLSNHVYRHGKHTTPVVANGRIYKAKDLVYRSGSTEPVWPNVSLGDTVEDSSGRILYRSVAMPTTPPPTWSANTRYFDGGLVSPSVPVSIPPNLPLQPNPIPLAFQAQPLNKSTPDIPAIPATGTYNGATYTAVTPGAGGNAITLPFDGIKNNTTVVGDWNAVHPTNQVGLTTGSPTAVSPAGSLTLSGGTNLVSGEPVWPGSILPPC